MKSMHDWFKLYDIPYFITGGTLVGAKRNHPPGIIKWDDDIDVGIPPESEHLITKLFSNQTFQKEYYTRDASFGYQIMPRSFIKSDGTVETSKDDGAIFDIFVYAHQPEIKHPTNEKVKWFIKGKGAKMWPKEGFGEKADMDIVSFMIWL
jgi:phosphorylcholine metabolism protein LicD